MVTAYGREDSVSSLTGMCKIETEVHHNLHQVGTPIDMTILYPRLHLLKTYTTIQANQVESQVVFLACSISI